MTTCARRSSMAKALLAELEPGNYYSAEDECYGKRELAEAESDCYRRMQRQPYLLTGLSPSCRVERFLQEYSLFSYL